MKLYGTPRSHFARRARLLLDHLNADYEMVDVGNVATLDEAVFHKNPMMVVPVFEDGDVWLIDSDHICQYIARKFDPEDRFRTLSTDPNHLNMRAMMRGVMDHEVRILMARRLGGDITGMAYFDKAKKVYEQGLKWVEDHKAEFNLAEPGDLEFHLVCMWQHLKYFSGFDLPDYDIGRYAADLAARETFRKSAMPEEL